MKSLLFQGVTPFAEPPSCAIAPCRTEVRFALQKNGRIYRFVARDKVAPEDPYFVLVKAAAFALDQGEPYAGRTPPRAVKDFLLKSSVVI
jgi:hypothetical protein